MDIIQFIITDKIYIYISVLSYFIHTAVSHYKHEISNILTLLFNETIHVTTTNINNFREKL